jgi:hypothetical protein
MINKLTEAWKGFLDLYVRTSIQPPGGPVSAVIWSEADVQLFVAHLLMSAPGGRMQVHQEVAGFLGLDPVDLVVTDPRPWLADERAPWATFTRATPVDLAVEVKVVNNLDDHESVTEGALKLHAIHKAELAREVALCVLDKTSPPERDFYKSLQDAGELLVIRAFDEDLPRVTPLRDQSEGAPGAT